MLILFFILGACMASFIMCLADRINRQISLRGFSVCDNCQHRLDCLSLMPILGWLISIGHCRYCRCSIPMSYPIFEACFGILFIVFSDQLDWLILICLCLFLSCEDLYDRRAHAAILYPVIIFELVCHWQLETVASLLAITLFCSFFIYYRRSMGSGDLPVLLILYLMVEPITFAVTILLASLSAIACCCLKKVQILPLIPFLSAAVIVSRLFVYNN
ncbi:MAG: prepilin peptidase [Oenococcus sp.]|uniref:prepilin peptidase n=1 Tax=Oenococcus sp. TaxID=1979414 RepID=UPI0039E78A19